MPELSEGRIRHLEMIQGAVNRLAGNSAMVKRYAIAVTAGAVALGEARVLEAPVFVGALAVVVAFFAWLDAMYLKTEGAYRRLFNAVRQSDQETGFSLSPHGYQRSVWRSIVSWSVAGFYGPLVALILLMLLFIGNGA